MLEPAALPAQRNSPPWFGLFAALLLVCLAGLGYWHLTQEPTAPAEMPGSPTQATSSDSANSTRAQAIAEPEHASAMPAANKPSTQDVVPNSSTPAMWPKRSIC